MEASSCIGNRMLEKYFPDIGYINKTFDKVIAESLPISSVYQVYWGDVREYYASDKANSLVSIPGTIGFHWFGGSKFSDKVVNDITGAPVLNITGKAHGAIYLCGRFM